MDIYTDYANWKFENYDFIHHLVERKSATISRFSSVLVVVDYLYERYLKRKSATNEEKIFFETGFDYIHDAFYTIKTLYDYNFNQDYDQLEQCAKTINLLLYIHEFQSELGNSSASKQDIEKLNEFEEKVSSYLDKKENVPDAFFPMLDDLTTTIFEKENKPFHSIESIFYEVALEYGLYKEDEIDIYNSVFQFQKEHHGNQTR